MPKTPGVFKATRRAMEWPADAMGKWLPPNGFTGGVRQMDAKVGVRIEGDVVVTARGSELLSHRPSKLETIPA
jgi:Xaa-Pro aminopeptidase